MRLTLFRKLFISLLLISSIMMVGMALLINNSFQTGLQNYLNHRETEEMQVIAEKISQYYSPENGWRMIEEQPYLWTNLLRKVGNHPARERANSHRDRPPQEQFLINPRIFLLNVQGEAVLDRARKMKERNERDQFIKVPIILDEQNIGWIAIIQKEIITGKLTKIFFKQQLNNFYWIAAWAALFSFVVAALLVRHFLQPLKNLGLSVKALQRGDFNYQIPVKGQDELAELSKTFNHLTNTLKLQKVSREQWIADISHELRTPIAVLVSEIEAIEDGIRKPEPKYIKSLHEQVMNLSRLVDDLYQLSLSDAGVLTKNTERVNLTRLLDNIANQNELRLAEKNIHLQRCYDSSKATLLQADPNALSQLILNLFENSYRYTDPDGQLKLTLSQRLNRVELIIEDSAPAVPDDALPKLFERLFRVDKSRSRANGGSGLGLSICQNIVKAQGGEIGADHSPLGGLKIKITLPAKDI
ncbi:sensor histidine kinase with ATPase domain [Psychromonas ingrahamii 37]|uniref:histidine kinase n=1 Tax=Psychromonas ingrahamii (strain DSM 17664 / CCUG 51855 / 37) TaxID=357804 RepID=A1STL2_PSYIN|nr:ATP-binding protein [Psychromonas ingrahamii]ABM02827.1 sensor histidine kinase with ATPase domain [Psychromonas ingrahamii 37]